MAKREKIAHTQRKKAVLRRGGEYYRREERSTTEVRKRVHGRLLLQKGCTDHSPAPILNPKDLNFSHSLPESWGREEGRGKKKRKKKKPKEGKEKFDKGKERKNTCVKLRKGRNNQEN